MKARWLLAPSETLFNELGNSVESIMTLLHFCTQTHKLFDPIWESQNHQRALSIFTRRSSLILVVVLAFTFAFALGLAVTLTFL